MSFGLVRGFSLEKACPRHLRPGRSISVSAVPFGPGTDIWRSCRLLASLMRSLCLLPGGLGRFVPCSIGANHCRLRHIGWEKCGHGLSSRPRESASVHFLNELLVLFRYPSGSGHALLAGTLPLRYCTTRFACMMPTWRLPALGAVHSLVGHGLTSRPRESASLHFLDELLALFRYPSCSGRALLGGTLPLRYCSTRFACVTPSWRLPALGSVRSLVAAYSDGGHLVAVDGDGRGVCWVSASGPGWKRIRLIRKTPAHLVGYLTHSRPGVWKRLSHVGFHQILDSDRKRRRCEQNRQEDVPSQDRTGVG